MKKVLYHETGTMTYSKTCVREPPSRLTLNSRWCGKSFLSYKGTCHVIFLSSTSTTKVSFKGGCLTQVLLYDIPGLEQKIHNRLSQQTAIVDLVKEQADTMGPNNLNLTICVPEFCPIPMAVVNHIYWWCISTQTSWNINTNKLSVHWSGLWKYHARLVHLVSFP